MDYYLNDSSTEIYDNVKDKMKFWRDYVYEKSDKSFETQLEEYVFETYNSESYLDNNDYPDTDKFAFDLLDIAREISKYYESDYGVPFKIHEYTNKKIVNLFALLCAENIQGNFIELYEESPDCYDRIPNGVCRCHQRCWHDIDRVSDSESEDETPKWCYADNKNAVCGCAQPCELPRD